MEINKILNFFNIKPINFIDSQYDINNIIYELYIENDMTKYF
jgi:hypothetical protein